MPIGIHPSNWTITVHAQRRYRERWRPTWRQAEADRELAGAVLRATHVEDCDGDSFYRTQRGAILVVSIDGAVRTVLPRGATRTDRRPRR